MTDPRIFIDDDDGGHTYSQEERELIINEISKRLFDERKFFVLLMWNEEAPQIMMNGGRHTTKRAMEFVLQRYDDIHDDPGVASEVFADYKRRQ